MLEMQDYVSPFDERAIEPHEQAPRLAALAGKRLSLFSISKPKSAEFLDTLERLLVEEHGAVIVRHQKPTFTKPAPKELIDEVVASCDGVIEALAD
jgi:hypothetical protein